MATLSSLWGKRPAKPVTPAGAAGPPGLDTTAGVAAGAAAVCGGAVAGAAVVDGAVKLSLPTGGGKAGDVVPAKEAVSYMSALGRCLVVERGACARGGVWAGRGGVRRS